MFEDLKSKNKQICVVGLGYVGLPLAREFYLWGVRALGLNVNTAAVHKIADEASAPCLVAGPGALAWPRRLFLADNP